MLIIYHNIKKKQGLTCTTKFELKKHSTVHTGEKQFECEVCQKKFRTKSFDHF